MDQLNTFWKSHAIKDILRFCVDKQLIPASEGLQEHLRRDPRTEGYDEAIHGAEKGDWLADAFFAMDTSEIPPYASFIGNNTAYSTQHGVKGEQYPKVFVLYDDIEASWNNYSFGKALTPATAGLPTERQLAEDTETGRTSPFRGRLRISGCCFSRQSQKLPREELIARGLLRPEQIEIAS